MGHHLYVSTRYIEAILAAPLRAPPQLGCAESRCAVTITRMTQDATPTPEECPFCAIASGADTASMVHADDTVMVFMDINPVTRGHLLVVPRVHAPGFAELDADTSARVWAAGQEMARTLRRSSLGCTGINVLVCDGADAFQTVPHFHLHVIPRYPDDGWTLNAVAGARARSLLDGDAQVIKHALVPGAGPGGHPR
jgi:diadenosine tetraphosphate (Ap4A) HIT family hydrolase